MSRNLIYIIFILIVIFSVKTYAQHPSESLVDEDKYGSDIVWSCSDKHFAYYFIDYEIPIPLVNGIENELRSHSLRIGYTYRYRLIDFLDIGAEAAYVNRISNIKHDSIPIFDPGTFYNKVKTYQNGFSGSVYFRVTFAENTYRNLGYFMDIGGYYDYYFWYGAQYVLKNNDVYQKTRFKKSDYIANTGYGAFIRFAKNNIGLTFSYSLSDWISGFSNHDLSYERSPFLIGLQMNLYAK